MVVGFGGRKFVIILEFTQVNSVELKKTLLKHFIDFTLSYNDFFTKNWLLIFNELFF